MLFSIVSIEVAIFFSVILEKTVRIPRSLSVKAGSILKGLLSKNPMERLGCHKNSGFMEILAHPFFKTIKWDAVSHQGWLTSHTALRRKARNFWKRQK